MTNPFEIFMVATPGLEKALHAEALANGFADAKMTPGGIAIIGTWEDVWRANLVMRGATRILARLGSFMAFHLAQLDKRARKFPWGEVLRPDVPVRVEVSTSRKSKIYHAGAATQRVETALKESHAMTISADAPVVIKLRIDDNRVTISVDTSGASLHKRGHKEAVGKAPMRETLAALMLRECGYDGREPVLDPMCGSGTFLIEAAEMAMGLHPGRTRSFAFQQLATFDADAWEALLNTGEPRTPTQRFHGSDRDAGAIRMASTNAEKAGVGDWITFQNLAAADVKRPNGPPGLIICNPPYGGRIGNQKMLYGVYAGLGQAILQEFAGWRVGLVTSEQGLAKATGLPFKPKGAPIAHGGLKIWLFQTGQLGAETTRPAPPT